MTDLLLRVAGDVWLHVVTPVCALEAGRMVHAVASEHALDWSRPSPSRRRKTWDTVCGARGEPWLLRCGPRPAEVAPPEDLKALRRWERRWGSRSGEVIDRVSLPFPPEVAALRQWGMTRCRTCHEATGRKRPRIRMRRPDSKEARS